MCLLSRSYCHSHLFQRMTLDVPKPYPIPVPIHQILDSLKCLCRSSQLTDLDHNHRPEYGLMLQHLSEGD